MRANLDDLHHSDIKICRASTVFTTKDADRSLIKYHVSFYFKHQGGRFKIDEYSLVYDSSSATKNVMFQSDSSVVIKLTGAREIIASHAEGFTRHQFYYLLPLYSNYGEALVGTQILKKKGSENKNKMIVFNLFDQFYDPSFDFKYQSNIVKFGFKKLFTPQKSVAVNYEICKRLKNFVQSKGSIGTASMFS